MISVDLIGRIRRA
jgi:hypothetical protein